MSDFARPLNELEAGDELRPLQFNRAKYLDYEALCELLSNLPNRKRKVNKSALSVNGRVVADKMENYLKAKGESSSALKKALISPRDYLIYKDPRLDRNKECFSLGTFCHSAFLEPKKFDKVRVEPQANTASNEGICTLIRWYWEELGVNDEHQLDGLKQQELRTILTDLRERFAEAGYTIIKEEYKIIIDIIRRAYKIYGGGILPRLLNLADSEVSMYGNDLSTGLSVKIRPDAMLLEENIGANIIVSMKTTTAATIEQYARDCIRYGYGLSEGMYLDVASHITGRQFVGTLMVVLQTCEPYHVFTLWWSPEDLETGIYHYRQAIDIIAECKEKKSYPGFDALAEDGAQGIIKFELPAYSRAVLKEQNI